MGDDHIATYRNSESPCAVFSPAVQITLPNTMHLTDSDGTVYAAEQMHYHWGGKNSELSGSEHTIDGIRNMIEICDHPPQGPLPFKLQCLHACVI